MKSRYSYFKIETITSITTPTFKFGATAPTDCLQYFTASTGQVSSFNWKDVTPTANVPRQLANQDYNICFRTELVNSQVCENLFILCKFILITLEIRKIKKTNGKAIIPVFLKTLMMINCRGRPSYA